MRNGQIVEYVGSEPEQDDIDAPADTDLPALAYSRDGSGPTIEWLADEQRCNIPEAPSVPGETGVFGSEGGVFGSEGGIF
mgnify:CR=1 FL=1